MERTPISSVKEVSDSASKSGMPVYHTPTLQKMKNRQFLALGYGVNAYFNILT